jgi:hypothetical protein
MSRISHCKSNTIFISPILSTIKFREFGPHTFYHISRDGVSLHQETYSYFAPPANKPEPLISIRPTSVEKSLLIHPALPLSCLSAVFSFCYLFNHRSCMLGYKARFVIILDLTLNSWLYKPWPPLYTWIRLF